MNDPTNQNYSTDNTVIKNSGNQTPLSDDFSGEQPEGLSQAKKPKAKGFFRELIEFALIAILIVVPFRIFVAQPYLVNGASMDPTFATNDYLIVDQLSYHFSTPQRGSVIIFKYPKNPSLYFIKRIIGLPGETVTINDGDVSVSTCKDCVGVQLNEPYVKLTKKENYSITLRDNEYFVLGDNRIASADSRIWGPVPKEDIVGRPIFQLIPLRKITLFPGDKTAIIQGDK